MCNRDQRSEFDSITFWLLIAALSLALTTREASAADETRPKNATPPGLPARITTLDGKTYEKVVLEKVEPDGLLVLFTPTGGGSGTAKLKFRNLPPELRERYAYDPARASDYEVAQARGEAMWLAESAIWEEQRRAARAEQAALERQMRAEAEARRIAEEEWANAEAARNAQQEPAYYYGVYNSFSHHHGVGGRYQMSGRVLGECIPRSPISPYIGPTRPSGR